MNQLSFLKRQLTEIQCFLKVGYWEYRFKGNEMGWSDELFRLLEIRDNSVMPSFDELFKRTHPEDISLVHNAYQRVESADKEIEFTHRMLTKSGKELFVKQMVKLERPEGLPGEEFIVGVICDISDKIFYEKARDELQQNYMLTAKLASLGRIANAIAHKINNPLMVLSGNTQLLSKFLKEHDCKDEKANRYISTIFESLDRITGIASGLRSYADAGIDGDEIFNVNTIIERTHHFASLIKLAPDIEVSVSLAPEELMIFGNVGKFQQVILNVFTNAVDALAGKKDKVIRIASSREGEMVCITILDNGHGIEPDNMSRVFESFYSTKERDTGIGIGLSIARNIIEALGGSVSLSSTIGEGTTAKILIPAYN